MAKSKSLKQQEAIERARAKFPEHAARWRQVMRSHEQMVYYYGVDHADQTIRQETLNLIKHMKLAKCDAHGNAIIDPYVLAREVDYYRRLLNTKLTSLEVPSIPLG